MTRLVPLMALLAPTSAFAWKHTNFVWTPQQMPIVIHVGDDCEESVADGDPEGEEDYCVLVSKQGMEAWEDAQCADFTWEYGGRLPNDGNSRDGIYTINWNDIESQIENPATLAVTYSFPSGTRITINGELYDVYLDADIIFNDNVAFETDANVLAGNCNSSTNMRSVMTHEMGHSMGLGHSCENPAETGEICLDPLLLDATMYWSEGPCESDQVDINDDDIDGFTALYGPFASFVCSHELDPNAEDAQAIGVICPEGESCDHDGFNLRCRVVTDVFDELTGAEWDFGDGGTASEYEPVHEYTTPGNYTVRVTFTGERDGCGEWSYQYRRVGYVTACGIPDVAASIEHVDGLTYTLLNETDLSVYGCIQDVLWEVYQGGTLIDQFKAWEPEYTFPEPGEYRVVLNVGGIAGTGAAEFTFDARRARGANRACSTVGMSGLGSLGLFLVGLAATRRRRS